MDDPIHSVAYAILIIVARKFFTTGWSRIRGKIVNALDDLETIFPGSGLDFFDGRRMNEVFIACHVSENP